MSTTDPGLNSPTAVGSRPSGAEAPPGTRQSERPPGDRPQGERPQGDRQQGERPRRADTPRGTAPVRTTTAPLQPGQPRPAGPQHRPTGTQAPVRPGQPGQAGQPTRGAQPRPGQPGQPGQARAGQPRPGQARAGQPGPGQARPGQARPGQPRPGQPRPGARPGPAAGRPARRGPRKARLSLARLDPWSVLKLAFLLSVALGIIGVVVTAVVWNVVDGMGVFTDIDEIVGQVTGDSDQFTIYSYVGFEGMLSLSVVIAVANVVILTALATLFAFVYNISSGLVGGLHVTLTDE